MRMRYAAIAVATLTYVALTHWLMTAAPGSAWLAVALVVPLLVGASLVAWRKRWRVVAALGFALAAGLVGMAMAGAGASAPLVYLGQHVAVHLALAAVFGVTLRRGATPLITALADRVHGPLTPAKKVYTRKLTIVWVAYFTSMAALSVLLFVAAPFEAWAVFANLVTPLAMGVLFIGEYWLRFVLHPEFERTRLIDAVRAYSQHGRAAPTPPAPQRRP
ncbi:hypothetical protein [Piscinibacter koreensis]|uniref:Transmembrane protein n=1 Tax=Piscinibacter koreensis TaxID=2742824 RepID=A0A7Y6TVZ0_9BURK|nr:hypothetical protein [Schlegelella koreensis]NUZ05451.1 hypothetical protein [Schlegelella koreensis]